MAVVVGIYKPYWLRLAVYKALTAARQIDTRLLVQNDLEEGRLTGFRGVYLGASARQRRITIVGRNGVKTFAASQPLSVNCQPAFRKSVGAEVITEKNIWFDLSRDKRTIAGINSSNTLDDMYKLKTDAVPVNAQLQLIEDMNSAEVIYALMIPCSR